MASGGRKSWLFWAAITFGIIVSIATPVASIYFAMSYRPYKTPTVSMVPALLPGDHFYAAMNLDRENLTRGAIYLFHDPKDKHVVRIMRLVGLPGDTVQVKDRKLLLNGKPIEAKPIPDLADPELNGYLKDSDALEERIGDTTYVSLWSKEPKYHAPQKRFTVAEGELFFLGDNRDNASDSRYFGTVSKKDVLGRPDVIWLSVGNGGLRGNRFLKRVR